MKIRNSFISNSSSSSFVIAFPKKPKSEMELFKMLFGEDLGAKVESFTDPISGSDAAVQVFKDLHNKRKATLKEITEEFFNRYHYYDLSTNSMEWAGEKLGFVSCYGWGARTLERYFGNDPVAMENMARLAKETKDLNAKQKAEEKVFFQINGLEEVPYIHDASREHLAKYKEYTKKRDALLESKNGMAFRDKQWKERKLIWDEEQEERTKAAKADAKKFMQDNKDVFSPF